MQVRIMAEGLTSGDFWAFEQLCIKANEEQLIAMRKAILAHYMRRENDKLANLVAKVAA